MQYLRLCSHLLPSGTRGLWHCLAPVHVTALQFCLERNIFLAWSTAHILLTITPAWKQGAGFIPARGKDTRKPFLRYNWFKKGQDLITEMKTVYTKWYMDMYFIFWCVSKDISLCCKLYQCIKSEHLKSVTALRLIHEINQKLIHFRTNCLS